MTELSKAEHNLVYELLGLFPGGTYDWYDYNDWTTGEIASVPIFNQVGFSVAVTRLEEIITAINAADSTDNRRARLSAILTEYEATSFDTGEIAQGGASGAAGFRFDPAIHRVHLRNLAQVHLGLRVEVHNSTSGRWGNGGRSMSVARG